MSEVLRYDAKKGLGPVDRVLLRGAASGKSANELSALTNGVIKPAESAARVIAILDSRDWLSQAQARMLLIDEMMQLKDELSERVHDFKSRDDVKPLISIFTLLEKAMAAEKLDLAKAMSEISRAHAALMLQGISLALERSFLELEKRYPEIRKVELMEVFHAAMPDVIRELESRVPSE